MAATSKDELLALTQKEFSKLDALLDNVGSGAATKKREDDTSIKDIVGHRAHWIDLFLGWYKDGKNGEEVFFPAQGYKWNQLKEYNAHLRTQQENLDWEDAKQMLRANNKKLINFIGSLTDDELYSGPMQGANNNWTTGRWAEAAGPSHYRSASKYIRKCLKERN